MQTNRLQTASASVIRCVQYLFCNDRPKSLLDFSVLLLCTQVRGLGLLPGLGRALLSSMQQESGCLPWLLSAHCVLNAPIYSINLKVSIPLTLAKL